MKHIPIQAFTTRMCVHHDVSITETCVSQISARRCDCGISVAVWLQKWKAWAWNRPWKICGVLFEGWPTVESIVYWWCGWLKMESSPLTLREMVPDIPAAPHTMPHILLILYKRIEHIRSINVSNAAALSMLTVTKMDAELLTTAHWDMKLKSWINTCTYYALKSSVTRIRMHKTNT